MSAPAAWRNRIIGSGEERPDDLLANPSNWRIHPKHQQDALAGVLNEVGWVQQVIVNQRTGHLIDGHLRVSLAMRQNEPTVPVLYIDVDEAEEALILATLDPLAAMAATDAAQLDALLRDVTTGEAAVQAMLAELAERNGVIPPDSFDPNAEWQGMPAYQIPESRAVKRVTILFEDIEKVSEFAELIGQAIPLDTGLTSLWFPPKQSVEPSIFVDE